jgi:hypothetical protein
LGTYQGDAMKKKVKKLKLAKETVLMLDLASVRGGASDFSCPDLSCVPNGCPDLAATRVDPCIP